MSIERERPVITGLENRRRAVEKARGELKKLHETGRSVLFTCPICGYTFALPEEERRIRLHLSRQHPHLTFKPEKVDPGSRIRLGEDFSVFKVRTAYEYSVLVDLISIAFSEDNSFRPLKKETLKREKFTGYVLIVVDRVAGYCLFSDFLSREPPGRFKCLRQIFLFPEFRGKGWGNRLVDEALKDLGVKDDEPWLVESPNENCARMIDKRPDVDRIGAVFCG